MSCPIRRYRRRREDVSLTALYSEAFLPSPVDTGVLRELKGGGVRGGGVKGGRVKGGRVVVCTVI